MLFQARQPRELSVSITKTKKARLAGALSVSLVTL
jgi:hypothetical protein